MENRSRLWLCLLLALVTVRTANAEAGNSTSPWPPWQYALLTNPVGQLPNRTIKAANVHFLQTQPANPKSVTLLKGIAALSPTSRLSIPASALPGSSYPAFSISMSIFLTEDSTGRIRTLFSRGENSNQRTPTLALLKNSRRLLFKVTTLFRPEISATSANQLPLFRWSHVTLTSDGFKTLTLFLNGEQDGVLYTDRDLILGHGGPFTLGKDHLSDGAAALMSQLTYFPYELSAAEVKREHEKVLATLPSFDYLAEEEAKAKGLGPEAGPKWREQVIEESEFVWRGEIAGSPPAADAPHFERALSIDSSASDAAELFSKLGSRFVFSRGLHNKICPVSEPFVELFLCRSFESQDRDLDRIRRDSGTENHFHHFWELLHANADLSTAGKQELITGRLEDGVGGHESMTVVSDAGPAQEAAGRLEADEVKGRKNSDLVEEVAHLFLQHLSPFRTVNTLLQRFLSMYEILAVHESLKERKENRAEAEADDEEATVHTEAFHAGSPEGETAYRARIAMQQFEAGKNAIEAAIRAESIVARHRRLQEAFRLLNQAADGSVSQAHLELAYLMAGHSGLKDQSESDAKGAMTEGGIAAGDQRVDWTEASEDSDGESTNRELLSGREDAGLGVPGSRGVRDAVRDGVREGTRAATRKQDAKESESRTGAQPLLWQQRITYHFLRAAEAGEVEAFAALGYRSLRGIGTVPCNESARYFLERAAEVAVEGWQRPSDRVVVERSLLHGALAQRVAERGHVADLLQLMAQRGHRTANLELGHWYLWGAHGLPRDNAAAARHLARAHAAGVPHAAVGLAKMLMTGEGVAQNASKALELYENAAEKGDREALNGLGYLAFHGLGGVTQNATAAFEYFQRAADLGSLDGMVNAGAMLRGGFGTPRDDVAAWRNFRAAAMQGHVPSAHQAAVAASHGVGTARNAGLAAQYFRTVAETGPWARHLQSGLATFLAGDEEGSLANYARAAELGYAPAQYNAAWLLENRYKQLDMTRKRGRVAAAAFHERLIAEGGSDVREFRGVRADLRAWSHVRLGDCVYYEDGCEERGDAAAHYRAASELGNGQGQFNLAFLLERGTHGVARNVSEAELFYRLAGDHATAGAAAAAALALAKLRTVRFFEKYGAVWQHDGPLRTWAKRALEELCETARWGSKTRSVERRSSGAANIDPTRPTGVSVGKETSDPIEETGSRDPGAFENVEQPDSLLLSAWKIVSEDWLTLGLCLALGFTLRIRWALRQEARPAARPAGVGA